MKDVRLSTFVGKMALSPQNDAIDNGSEFTNVKDRGGPDVQAVNFIEGKVECDDNEGVFQVLLITLRGYKHPAVDGARSSPHWSSFRSVEKWERKGSVTGPNSC
jgi:hypothetical protein